MDETKLKTPASRKGVPMIPELADALLEWRHRTPYPTDDDWVCFALHEWEATLLAGLSLARSSAACRGSRRHQQARRMAYLPAFTCNAPRTSKKDVKTVQELLRHANSRITMEVYQ
jgi:integrase